MGFRVTESTGRVKTFGRTDVISYFEVPHVQIIAVGTHVGTDNYGDKYISGLKIRTLSNQNLLFVNEYFSALKKKIINIFNNDDKNDKIEEDSYTKYRGILENDFRKMDLNSDDKVTKDELTRLIKNLKEG